MLQVALLGNSQVGKTSLLHAYAGKEFSREYVPTVFDSFQGTTVEGKYKVRLVDTSGSPDYAKLRPLAYPQIDIFLLVFSLTDRASFHAIPRWISECQYHRPNTPFILVGTKLDAPDKCVAAHEAEAFMALGAQTYIACSAKTHTKIDDIFRTTIGIGFQTKRRRPRWILF